MGQYVTVTWGLASRDSQKPLNWFVAEVGNVPISGFKLDNDGSVAIHIAAKKPAGVPDENWLPINRGDYGIDLIMRVYEPDLERYKSWTPPRDEPVN